MDDRVDEPTTTLDRLLAVDPAPSQPSLEEEQVELERECVDIGRARYLKGVEDAQKYWNELDTPPGQRLTNRMMRKLVPAMQELQKSEKARFQKSGAGNPAGPVIMALSANVMAAITLRTVMSYKNRSFLPLCRAIARYSKLELDWQAFKAAEKQRKKDDPEHFNLAVWWARKLKVPKPHIAQKWLKSLNAVSEPWSFQLQTAVGAQLANVLVQACPEEFHLRDYTEALSKSRPRTQRVIELTDEARRRIDAVHDYVGLLNPWRAPMVCPPKPWTEVKEDG